MNHQDHMQLRRSSSSGSGRRDLHLKAIDDKDTPPFSWSSSNKPIPEYDENAKAIEVFDNVYFYENDHRHHEFFIQHRKDVLGEMTIKQVYIKYAMNCQGGPELGLLQLACDIGTRGKLFLDYFKKDMKPITIEDAVNTMMSMCHTRQEDAFVVKKVLSQILPSG